MIAVMAIHAVPFSHAGAAGVAIGSRFDAATVVNQLARFAVPYFFVISGYFWGQRVQASDANVVAISWRMVRRLLLVFAAWSVVFVFPYESDRIISDFPHGFTSALSRNWQWFGKHPWLVMVQGTNGHLWYLTALASCVVISAVFVALRRPRLLWALAVALFLATLLAEPYHATPVGLSVSFNARNGPGFGLLFFATGVVLAARGARSSWLRAGVVLVVVGFAAQFAELAWLHRAYHVNLAQDFVASTALVGIGVALVALANPPVLRRPLLGRLGALGLGLYAVHPIFVDLLEPVAVRMASPWWDIGALAMVFALSLRLSWALSRWRWSRMLVV